LRQAVAPALLWALLCLVALPGLARGAKLSDQNRDGVVDLDDLILYSQNELGQDWQTVDWCEWLTAPKKREKHLRQLLDFIDEYFNCSGEDPLAIRNANTYPTRLAWGPDAQRIYVTDARVESLFIYDSALTLLGELKGLGKPLGVAVDPLGNIYVGNNRFDNVEVFGPDGVKTATIGAGTVQMPNDLAFDGNGKLYVADSRKNRIWIFDPATGANLGHIGAGQLRFPSALTISGQELFVADQANHGVKVFDLQGNLLRSLGGEITQGSLGYKWKGNFVRIQSVAIDGTGRLHALDSHMGVIQILNATTGGYITKYGTNGTAPGELSLPLHIAINQYGEVAVANNRNQRVDLLTPP
jgi:DNA-binding beta-propeller fold protein YncE